MTAAPGADEQRARHNLRRIGVAYAPQPAPGARDRDWLDDLWDDKAPAPQPRAIVPPGEPPDPPAETAAADEPRWDWRRLRHWPNTRPATTAGIALVATFWPIPHVGYSVATTWAYCVSQVRDNYGAGWGYAVGGGAFALAVSLVGQRGRKAGILRLTFAAVGLVGLTGCIHWFDLITLVTGGKPR